MALQGTVVTTTQVTNHLETVWSPRFMLDTTEMMEIGNNFLSNDDVDVEKIANQLVIRKVAPKTTNKVAGTVALDVTSLSYEGDTEDRSTFNPQFAYTAVAVSKQAQTRMLAFPKYDKAVREQFLRSMSETIDIDCGDLGDNLSVTAVGVNADAALIRQAIGELRTNAKRYYTPGKNVAYLVFHPSQWRFVHGIAEINNANLRGTTGEGPNATGVLVEAWGARLAFSGNIVSSGGKRHNMIYLKDAFVLAYNEKPQITKDQDLGLARHLHGFCEYAAGELYDAYAVDVQTDA